MRLNSRNMIIELTDMAPTGEAIGRHDGLVIFVPYGLPGEQVEIEVVHQRRNFARGRLVQVLRPSDRRIAPPCPYFGPHAGACGGCEWQHADYAAQLEFKTRAVREQLVRIGRFAAPDVQPCLPSPRPYHYRNHTQLVLSPQGRPGYYMAGSHDVVEIEQCPIAAEPLNDLLRTGLPGGLLRHPELRAELRELHLRAGAASSANSSERMAVFELNRRHVKANELPRGLGTLVGRNSGDSAVSIAISGADGSSVTLAGRPYWRERVGAEDYSVSPGAFFQVNTGTAGLLVAEVLAALALTGTEHVLDLYCGAGLFTLPVSRRAASVLGVEASPQPSADARRNLATRDHSDNAHILTADVGAALARQDVREQHWDAVILDPPRAGVERDALERVIALRAGKLVYVSCDPATLARDARLLNESGYTLGRVQPLDMFPQTHHVESVAVLARSSDA
jgi:23S rRNA (uracil1939-C5)-methyltransferase